MGFSATKRLIFVSIRRTISIVEGVDELLKRYKYLNLALTSNDGLTAVRRITSKSRRI